jgi:hypothetical protein
MTLEKGLINLELWGAFSLYAKGNASKTNFVYKANLSLRLLNILEWLINKGLVTRMKLLQINYTWNRLLYDLQDISSILMRHSELQAVDSMGYMVIITFITEKVP